MTITELFMEKPRGCGIESLLHRLDTQCEKNILSHRFRLLPGRILLQSSADVIHVLRRTISR